MKVWRDSLVGLIRLTLEKNRPVNSSDLRFGLIGAGRWGKIYIKTLERMDGFELVRLASTNPNAKKLVNSNCLVTKDWRDVAKSDDLDGVIIATPPQLHAKMMRVALANSNPVLVEKPLTVDLLEAREILNFATKMRSIVHVDHTHLYHGAYRLLKSRGLNLGQVKEIESCAGDWGPFRCDTNVLWDRGSHEVAMCLDLLSEYPESISANTNKKKHTDDGSGEAISIHLIFSSGVKANLEISNLLIDKKRDFYVHYEKETLFYNGIGEPALSRTLKSGEIQLIKVTDILPLDQVIIDFGAAIARGKSDLDGLRLGVNVVNVLQECQNSLLVNDPEIF